MAHAEYKVAGGKLVVIDLKVRAGQLRQVQLSGDFFLEPDSALAQINQALEGLPADAPAPQIETAINASLDPEVRMYGFCPADVATVVQRAVHGAGHP